MLGHYAFALFILSCGALMLLVFRQSLKSGYVSVDGWPPRFHRKDNPFGYWISQLAMLAMGLLLVGAGLSGLFLI